MVRDSCDQRRSYRHRQRILYAFSLYAEIVKEVFPGRTIRLQFAMITKHVDPPIQLVETPRTNIDCRVPARTSRAYGSQSLVAIFTPIHHRLAAVRGITDRSVSVITELNERGSIAARHKLNSAAILGAAFWAPLARGRQQHSRVSASICAFGRTFAPQLIDPTTALTIQLICNRPVAPKKRQQFSFFRLCRKSIPNALAASRISRATSILQEQRATFSIKNGHN
jgi:hypothetical protein